MKRNILVGLLALSLVGVCSAPGAARDMGYIMERDVRGFPTKPAAEPSASVVAADAVIARPVGLALTIGGTGLFIATLPFSAISGSVDNAARGLIGKPGGWTFVRPMGRGDKRFEEKGVFE
jgi:hypothetical protein